MKNYFFINQVHSNSILRVSRLDKKTNKRRADGLISTDCVSLAIKTADCIPLLLCNPKNHSIAAIHVGWRGLVSGIIPKIIKKISQGNSLESILVAIGPHIGVCCYTVPSQRLEYFTSYIKKENTVQRKKHKNVYLDIGKVAMMQLEMMGIRRSQIDLLPYCTSCDSRFNSYRRDGPDCPRMISMIENTT